MLVLDPHYGAQARPDLGDAFWLIASASNRALAARARAANGTDPNSAVFESKEARSNAEDVMGLAENIDLHHPEWTEIEVVGVGLTPDVQAALGEWGRVVVTATDRFSIHR